MPLWRRRAAPDEARWTCPAPTLRSVSPVHLEYLRNMGVRASLSVSLLQGERLWGLIACHHLETPRLMRVRGARREQVVGQVLAREVSLQPGAEERSAEAAGAPRVPSWRSSSSA